jgi:hypothetical protein
LHLICALSCACLHCISFKNFDMHSCVVYASYRTLNDDLITSMHKMIASHLVCFQVLLVPWF